MSEILFNISNKELNWNWWFNITNHLLNGTCFQKWNGKWEDVQEKREIEKRRNNQSLIKSSRRHCQQTKNWRRRNEEGGRDHSLCARKLMTCVWCPWQINHLERSNAQNPLIFPETSHLSLLFRINEHNCYLHWIHLWSIVLSCTVDLQTRKNSGKRKFKFFAYPAVSPVALVILVFFLAVYSLLPRRK